MFAEVVELDLGPGDEVDDGARDDDITVACGRGDPLGDVDRETEQVVTSEFDFTGMETTSNSESKLSSAPRDGLRAADRSSGAIEGRNDSIAGALHETPNP